MLPLLAVVVVDEPVMAGCEVMRTAFDENCEFAGRLCRRCLSTEGVAVSNASCFAIDRIRALTDDPEEVVKIPLATSLSLPQGASNETFGLGDGDLRDEDILVGTAELTKNTLHVGGLAPPETAADRGETMALEGEVER